MTSLPSISILVPTRGRPHNLARLQASVIATAAVPRSIEFVFYIDEDDRTRSELDLRAEVNAQIVVGPKRPMGQMFGALYEHCNGALVILAGDDIVFRTAGWDRLVLDRAAGFDGGIALLYGNDRLKGEELCTHPIMPRATCELLGRPCPSEYPGEYIDTHLFDTFAKLRALGEDRIAYLPDVIIEHMHYSVGKAPYDETYQNRAPTATCKGIFAALDPRRAQEASTLLTAARVRPSIAIAASGR